MKASERILKYRSLAGMLQVQPCTEHVRLFIEACEEDEAEYEKKGMDDVPSFEADRIIMEIGRLCRPVPRELPEERVRKASLALKLIRDYLASGNEIGNRSQ